MKFSINDFFIFCAVFCPNIFFWFPWKHQKTLGKNETKQVNELWMNHSIFSFKMGHISVRNSYPYFMPLVSFYNTLKSDVFWVFQRVIETSGLKWINAKLHSLCNLNYLMQEHLALRIRFRIISESVLSKRSTKFCALHQMHLCYQQDLREILPLA